MQCLLTEGNVPSNVDEAAIGGSIFEGGAMRQLLNTLYITKKDAFLTLDGENIVVKADGKEIARFPLHLLDGIITFSHAGASPALMGICTEKGIALSFCTPHG